MKIMTNIILVSIFLLPTCAFAYSNDINDYYNSDYVTNFNIEFKDFWNEMRVFLDDSGNTFISSKHTANWKKENYKSIGYNLFLGNNYIVHQISTAGSAGLTFTSNDYNLKGKLIENNIMELSCEQETFRLTEIMAPEKKAAFLQKVKFVPIYPERRQLFYFKQHGVHKFIDTYSKNLIPGETRYFEGTPGNMQPHRIKEVIAFDSDRNPIFVLESGRRINIPERINGVLKSHDLNGKKLGINNIIPSVTSLDEQQRLNCSEILIQ